MKKQLINNAVESAGQKYKRNGRSSHEIKLWNFQEKPCNNST